MPEGHAMEHVKGAKHQEVRMLNRKTLEMTGVSNVESFDNEEFLLQTECGFLAVRGQSLHMKNLNLEQGQVAIEGTVHSLVYLDGNPAKSKGLFGKLFK
jgi:sporulation protein YabP